MVVDNGCDQSIININSFLIYSFAGVLYNVGGALGSMTSSNLELVNDTYTLATLPDNTKVIFLLHQCFLDRNPSQTEALLQPNQVRAHNIVVDDCAACHVGCDGQHGGQCLKINDIEYKLHFDGWKSYFQISKPTSEDLVRYPMIELTSRLLYEPQRRRYSRQLSLASGVSTEEWRYHLGYPTLETATATLNHTTHLICFHEADTRDYMRDHLSTRVWALRPRWIDDDCYSDTFFSSIISIRKYKCL